MCLNKTAIRLKNGRIIYVNCGYCPACLQEKANKRTSLIRNERRDGFISLFVTLTYDNRFLPFIRKSDLDASLFDNDIRIPVYRHYSTRRVRMKGKKYGDKLKINGKIGEVGLSLPENFDFSHLTGYRVPVVSPGGVRQYVNHDDKVSVIWYKDLQNFYKQLKIRYERNYDKKLDFSSFHVAEYGPTTRRAHFHACITCKFEDAERVRATILESWRFCDRARLSKYIEFAKDASSYLASYVNSSTYLPQVYFSKDIRPKSSHTKFYGFKNPDFSLDKILEKTDKGDLHYDVPFRCGESVYLHSFLLPGYVLSYYFPKIKGFSKLSSEELSAIYAYPSELARYARKLGYDSHSRQDIHKGTTFLQRFQEFSFSNPPSYNSPFLDDEYIYNKRLDYISSHSSFIYDESTSVNDYVVNVRMLKNAFSRFMRDFHSLFGYYPTTDLYAYYATRVWSVRGSNLIKDSYDIPEDSRYLDAHSANNNIYDINRDKILTDKFWKYDKSKKVNNLIYSSSCVNF